MSFFDRSVPLKYAILFAAALTVYVSLATSALHNREKVRQDYGAVLRAKVIKAGKPKTTGCVIFGLGCKTYTKTEVEVYVRSGPWDYSDVDLAGRASVGHKVQVWFDKGNSNDAYIANEFDVSNGVNYAAPWDSVFVALLRPFILVWWGVFCVAVLLNGLLSWDRRRKQRKRKLQRKPATA